MSVVLQGEFCTEGVNECTSGSHTCENGTLECEDLTPGFKCVCHDNYTGKVKVMFGCFAFLFNS